MKYRFRILVGLIGLGILATSVACSKSQKVDSKTIPKETITQEETAEKKKEEVIIEPITLNLVTMFGDTDPIASAYKSVLETFQTEYQSIVLQDDSKRPDANWQAGIALDFAAQNEPDILYFYTDERAKTFVETGQVVSVEEIQKSYPDYAKAILPSALKACAYPGYDKTYAVPIMGSYESLFCNKDLFEENNIDLPTDWDKFEKAIQRFSQKGIMPIALMLDNHAEGIIEQLLLAEGGIADENKKDMTQEADKWLATLQKFKKLYQMGAFKLDTATLLTGDVGQAFINKEAAMYIGSDSFMEYIIDGENTVVVPMPSSVSSVNQGTGLIMQFNTGFYITKKAWDDPKKREAAVKLIEKMTQPKFVMQCIKAKGGGLAATQIGEITGLSRLRLTGVAMTQKAGTWDTPLKTWLNKEAWSYLNSKIKAIAEGQIEPEEVIKELIVLQNKAKL